MYSELKKELTLPLANNSPSLTPESFESKEKIMSNKNASCPVALVKDILNIIALKPEMFF